MLRGAVFTLVACVAGSPAFGNPQFTLEHTVDADVLVAGAVVEFVVTVRNAGLEAAEPGPVTVNFSPGLEAPVGTAPFFSQGSYDPQSRRWDIGGLPPDTTAELVLPGQVKDDGLRACEFAVAELESQEGDADPSIAHAFATLRAPGVERCADLAIEALSVDSRGFPFCGPTARIRMWIANAGPDPARDFVVTVHDVSINIAQAVLAGPGCTTSGTLECQLDELAPGHGAVWRLEAQLMNAAQVQVTFTVSVTSSDLENNPGQESRTETLPVAAFEACPEIDVGEINVDFDEGSSACFIATAAWGSRLHPRVATLRHFRDRYLLSHRPGRVFVALYYRLSPPLAKYIAVRPGARAVTRAALWPVLVVIGHPEGLLWLALCALLYARRRRRKTSRRGSVP